MGASIRQVVLLREGHCNTNLISYSVGEGFILEGLSVR